HDDVHLPRGAEVGELGGRDLARARRPVPRAGAPAAVGPAVGDNGHEVLVGARDERRRPRAVHVPDEHPHRATPAVRGAAAGAVVVATRGTPRRSTAARTSPGWTAPRHG